MKKLGITAFTVLTLLPLLAMAQPAAPDQVQFASGGIETVIKVINTIANYLMFALLALAGLFIVYAAYLYLTAAGDPEKVKSASNVIIYAVVAIGVGLLSKVIVTIATALIPLKK